jgi:hypothetical protein
MLKNYMLKKYQFFLVSLLFALAIAAPVFAMDGGEKSGSQATEFLDLERFFIQDQDGQSAVNPMLAALIEQGLANGVIKKACWKPRDVGPQAAEWGAQERAFMAALPRDSSGVQGCAVIKVNGVKMITDIDLAGRIFMIDRLWGQSASGPSHARVRGQAKVSGYVMLLENNQGVVMSLEQALDGMFEGTPVHVDPAPVNEEIKELMHGSFGDIPPRH